MALAAGLLTVGAAYMATGLIEDALPARPERTAAAPPSRLEEARPGHVSLSAGPDGHFRVDATIGGRRVPMLVDTGATVVALSYENGESLGLVSGGDRFDARVATANGSVGAKRVVLRDVRIGSVKVDDVAAVVLSPGAMDGALLGMSFLGRLRRIESARDRLVLER
ncbi:retropepsin-like aspartic protease family protein [Hansschlegelia zhihuaiae]|nr:TIGR02281 family clan AA aspartic protease [Hansschlegelia zhihuaiae]